MNYEDLIFYRTPFQEMFFKIRMEEHDSLRRIIRKNYIINDKIDYEINKRIHGLIENFVTILIKGEQGTFKSSVALCFCKKTDEKFDINRVCFLYESFNEKLKQSLPKQSFELDEEVWQHGTGSMRIIHESQSLIETLRKRQNSMIIACTIDKYFPEEIFTFYMETIDLCMQGTCSKNQSEHEIRTCNEANEQDHQITHVYVRLGILKKNHFIGLYIMPIVWNDDLWREYRKVKDAFLEQAKNQEFSKLNYETVAKEILKQPEAILYTRINQIKLLIQKYKPNLTREECDLLCEQIKICRKQEDGL